MNSIFRLVVCALLVAAMCGPSTGRSAPLTIMDTCQRSVSGSASSSAPDPLVATDSGVAITGFSANEYSAGLGQCDPLPADGKPACTLSASKAKLPVGGSATLFAHCTQGTTKLNWTGPALPTLVAQTSSPAQILIFDEPGAYSYSVVPEDASTVKGPRSAPVTILVGDQSGALAEPPTCVVNASPVLVQQGQSSTLQVSCQPEATSYAWDAAEPNAPASPASNEPVASKAFPSGGAFTYRVAGINAQGTGPKASATVNVVSTCPTVSTTYTGSVPSTAWTSADFVTAFHEIYSFSFTHSSTAINSLGIYQHSTIAFGPSAQVRHLFGDELARAARTNVLPVFGRFTYSYASWDGALERATASSGIGIPSRPPKGSWASSTEFRTVQGR